MSKGFNYDRRSNISKGWNGFSATPYYHSAIPRATEKQMACVKALASQLESAGVDTSSALKEIPFTVNGINSALSKLRELMHENGIKEFEPRFANVCRNKETGEKIRYRTSKRYCAPVGYEFLYEAKTDFVLIRMSVG